MRLIQTAQRAVQHGMAPDPSFLNDENWQVDCALAPSGRLRIVEREFVITLNMMDWVKRTTSQNEAMVGSGLQGFPSWSHTILFKVNRTKNKAYRFWFADETEQQSRREQLKNWRWYKADPLNIVGDILLVTAFPRIIEIEYDLGNNHMMYLLFKQTLLKTEGVDNWQIPSPLDGSMPQEINGALCYLIPNDEPVCLAKPEHNV
ncbi:hypothetical protein ACFQMB_09450 [Pseudobowmanella zhangzhouensis]